MVEVHWTNGSGDTSNMTRNITVLAGYGTITSAKAEPNLLDSANGMITTFDATGVATVTSIKVNIYAISGELVATPSSTTSGLAQATWNASGMASGIYIAVIQMYNSNDGLVGHQAVKVMVMH
jgi:hypothetical protein